MSRRVQAGKFQVSLPVRIVGGLLHLARYLQWNFSQDCFSLLSTCFLGGCSCKLSIDCQLQLDKKNFKYGKGKKHSVWSSWKEKKNPIEYTEWSATRTKKSSDTQEGWSGWVIIRLFLQLVLHVLHTFYSIWTPFSYVCLHRHQLTMAWPGLTSVCGQDAPPPVDSVHWLLPSSTTSTISSSVFNFTAVALLLTLVRPSCVAMQLHSKQTEASQPK